MRIKLGLLLLLPMIYGSAQLFDYGEPFGDQAIPFSRNQHAVTLGIPVVFLETSHSELYISSNGIVSFGELLPDEPVPLQRLNRSAIAVYYAPFANGIVYYRSTSMDRYILDRLCNTIHRLFADSAEFQCLSAIIVTWDGVESRDHSDGQATFQLALVTDGLTSFSIQQYGDLPFSSSGGIYAQSGFASYDGVSQSNVNSGGPDVKELGSLSNNDDGNSFVFRISGPAFEDPREESEDYEYGNLESDYDGEKRKEGVNCPEDKFKDNCPEGCNLLVDDNGCSRCLCAGHDTANPVENVEPEPKAQQPPQTDTESVRQPSSGSSGCAQAGQEACHADGQCRDYDNGYCCVCQPGFIGNGKECLRKGEPQRISGTFEATINGQGIEKTDLHTFISATDGNAYTAVSKIPSDQGGPLLLLNSINSVMGWLFAEVQSPTAYNGFMLTGGILNRTVTLHIGDRYYVTIKQHFSGRDLYNYYKASVIVVGTLPDIAPGVEIAIPDYEEEYKKEGHGRVRSYTSSHVTVKENGQETKMKMTVDQQIQFDECPHRAFDKDTTVTLHVKRVHVTYDPQEGIVRYASRNYAGKQAGSLVVPAPGGHFDRRQHGQVQQPANRPVDIGQGVCADGRHVCTLPNMRCKPWEHSYRCECVDGYYAQHDNSSSLQWSCKDINECERGGACSPHASCTNTEGSFTCQCNPGYSGDGRNCLQTSQADTRPGILMQPAQHIPSNACSNHQQCAHNYECAQTPGSSHGTCQVAAKQTAPPGYCLSHQDCERYFDCVTSSGTPFGSCQTSQSFTPPSPCTTQEDCQTGFECRSETCTSSGCSSHQDCPAYEECRLSTDGSRFSCINSQVQLADTCRNHQQCQPNEQCNFEPGSPFGSCRPYRQPQPGDMCRYNDECPSNHKCVSSLHLHLGTCQASESGSEQTSQQLQPGSCTNDQHCHQNGFTGTCVIEHDRQYGQCHWERPPQGSCASSQDCGPNSECVFLPGGRHGTCKQTEQLPQPPGSCTAHTQCHQWGECVFTPGTPFGQCKCRGWYVGDGVGHCGPPEARQQPRLNTNIPVKSGKPCGLHVCDPNAECMPDRQGGSECVCKAGFVGNGITCESLDLDKDEDEEEPAPAAAVGKVCRSHDECSEHGTCAYSYSHGYYQCSCTEPYVGNGVECYLPGQEQQPQPHAVTPGCDVLHNCHPNADCIFERSHTGGKYRCVCQSGYAGDGEYCAKTDSGAALPPLEQPGCDRVRNCHENAQCVYDSHNRKYKCECNEGFVGDGVTCVRIHGTGTSWEGQRVQQTVCREQTDCHRNAHCVSLNSGQDVCECLPGYRGDGVQSCVVADQCNPANPGACHQNAECVFGNVESAYVCKCVTGFTGDGVTCVPHAAPATCREEPRMCHANAQCVYNGDQNRHVCICKPGSYGDGYQKCEVQDTPRCTDCSIHAHCAQNSTTGAHHCKCNAGYQGNGKVCKSMTSCLDDRSICDTHAECVPGEGGVYVCNCHYGYHGNGRTCTPDTEGRRDALYVARGTAIFQRALNKDVPGKQVVVIPHHIAVGLDFDCENERLVWSDISGHSIRSASLNGSDHSSHYADILNSPEGIAVDYKSKNVYYVDSLNDELGVASLDGKYRKILLSEGLVNPRSVALDLQHRHLYYTDWNRENPGIGRIDMDGKNHKIFLRTDIHLPNGITVLPNRKEVCWVDAGNHRLSCIGFDGNNRRVVFAPLENPFGLTQVNEERFYWTDWKDNRVHSVGIYGEGYASFPISLGGSGRVYGIVAVPKSCHAPPSPCAVDNGGCSYLCLPGVEGVHCECPDNVSVKGC